jgi:hypothetical protein
MKFTNIDELESEGFEGFISIKKLWNSKCDMIPERPGVYIVYRNTNKEPEFLEKTIAGLYKGEDLAVSILQLKSNWNDHTPVIYIGKAGGPGIKQGLKSRLRKYVGTGFSQNAKRRGGKMIWQLRDAPELLLCWKTDIGNKTPKDFEDDLKELFKKEYGKIPFANLV